MRYKIRLGGRLRVIGAFLLLFNITTTISSAPAAAAGPRAAINRSGKGLSTSSSAATRPTTFLGFPRRAGRPAFWNANKLRMTAGSLPAASSGLAAIGPPSSSSTAATTMSSAMVVPHREGHSYTIPGGVLTKEHFFTVPVQWDSSSSSSSTTTPQIEIFVREMIPHTPGGGQPSQADRSGLPYLLYLQGGPGFAAPRVSVTSGWVKRALKDYRVLLLDQRGTGRSAPVSSQTLGHLTPSQQFDHLKHFRADSIVRDCEAVRVTLLGPNAKWTVLGQSFGGFCLLTYLSVAPHAVQAGLFTGGLPPVGRKPEEVYAATFKRLAARNSMFYARYPSDIGLVREIVSYLLQQSPPVSLPSGGFLTARRFLQLGLCLGSGTGMEDLHYLLEEAWTTTEEAPGGRSKKTLSYKFLRSVESWQAFDTNPLYALLHEPIYCEGQASSWAAQRVMATPEVSALFSLEEKFMADGVAKEEEVVTPGSTQEQEEEDDMVVVVDGQAGGGGGAPVFFLGEMIMPFMFEGDYPQLACFKEVAHLLAEYESWPRLYDPQALQRCNVPCAAIIYFGDVFVERQFSEDTARLLGPSLKLWVTNEWQHSGIREDGFFILDRLLGMLRGEVNIPS